MKRKAEMGQVGGKVIWRRRRQCDQSLWAVVVVSVAEILGIETSSSLTREDEKLQPTRAGVGGSLF